MNGIQQLQRGLSDIFGSKKKRRPAQHEIKWGDGSTGALIKRGSMWQFVAPDGCTHGHSHQSHALSAIDSFGGRIVKGGK